MQQFMIMMLTALTITNFVGSAQADDCAKAGELTTQAYRLGQQGAAAAAQSPLLEEALRLCPNSPEAHNNLGVLLEETGAYPQALAHYQAAAQAQPDFAPAWFGVGEVYRKTGQFALALEAYLRICQEDQDARKYIEDILVNQRYQAANEGDVLDQASLRLLFDPMRREAINRRLRECHFDLIMRGGTRATVVPEVIFRNLLFDVGRATLQAAALPQLQEIGAALAELPANPIRLSGHTDQQPFAGHTPAESVALNQQLSEARARTVAEYLVGRGIPRERLIVTGYGQSQLLVNENTPEAYRQNRRVTIEVE